MQVFTPYKNPLECAEALWSDSKRLNKQIIECKQIIAAIDGAKAWQNHPVCLMYKEHKEWLKAYLDCFVNFRNRNIPMAYQSNGIAIALTPPFLTDEFCDQHKRRLYTKAPKLYPQFAEYGTSEENWYVIDGQIVKYINGKRIN